MKKLLTIKYKEWAFNTALLLIRICFGGLMFLNHGLPKLMKFSTLQYKFGTFFGMGSRFSLIMVIFAEVFCSLFLVIGLFSRLVSIPLLITMVVAFFIAHHGLAGEGEMAALYLTAYFLILLVGPGKISVDGLINK